MAKKKKAEELFIYIPPPQKWYFYVGEKYYRKLQPIPYKKDTIPEYIKRYAKKSN